MDHQKKSRTLVKFHDVANLFPMMSDQELESLAGKIKANGFDPRHPIITYQEQILDGRNRYAACMIAGIDPCYQEYDGNDPLGFVVLSNIDRRNLSESQRALVAAKVANMPAHRPNKSANWQTSQSDAATMFNASLRSLARASFVLHNGTPELIAEVEAGTKSVSRAAREVARQQMREAKKGQPFPDGRFAVILADPPWKYDFAQSDRRAIENQYPTMELEEICNIRINNLVADDCVLFLWATNPKLPEALTVIHAWGFTYKTNMVWVKDKIGMGYYARQKHELLLIATRGNPLTPEPKDRPESVICAPRLEHSKKPVAFYEVIERMYPNVPRIELFARNKREGWEAWGNEW